MAYNINTEQFSGPLDLLLQLIEQEELDITTISLAHVADEYLRFVRTAKSIEPTQLADFLVIAAKLILVKSRALLPHLQLSPEEATDDLTKQLKLYQEFTTAAKEIERLIRQHKFSFMREKLPAGIAPEFSPPEALTIGRLAELYQAVINRLEPIVRLPQRMLEKVISLEEKIAHIRERLISTAQTSFRQLISHGNKADAIVSFLALLELVKQRTVKLEQVELFGDIAINRTS